MALKPGTQVGPYEITAPLGAGGMGEVYRATDTKLKREVAIKVLPDDVAGDRERLARFEREAHVLASLNHPHIGSIYGLEECGGVPCLVLELVEGQTLAERLAAGALPVENALEIARQIASALEAAHEKGIIHRDLKPANVKLTPEDSAKVLDFGLAKGLADESTELASDPSLSPTLTMAATRAGLILGTAAYMSPEQARGKPVDKRTDIWAFGCVFYELLTGRQAFPGETASDTIAKILEREPDWQALPSNTPLKVRELLQRCLRRDDRNRLHDIADARIETEEVLADPSGAVAVAVDRPGRKTFGSRWLSWTVAAAALVVVALAAGYLVGSRNRPVVTEIDYRQLTFRRGTITGARFSPDGSTVVYSAIWEGEPSEVFTTSPGNPESRALGLRSAGLLGISSSGELAVALEFELVDSFDRAGTLANLPLATSTAPRELLKNVRWADWSPDGAEFALVRREGRVRRLEYPMGTVLRETSGWISHPQISPDGGTVAFLEHPYVNDDRGFVALVDRSGTYRQIGPSWSTIWGLAWRPDGNEIWVTAGPASSLSVRRLYGMTLDGEQRVLAIGPGEMTLHDVSPAGDVLLSVEDRRRNIIGLPPGAEQERNLTWLDRSLVGDLSVDGNLLLFHEGGKAGGDRGSVYLRKLDGSPAVRLSDGYAISFSPDEKWVLTFIPKSPREYYLVPTGVGSPRHVDLSHWSPNTAFPIGMLSDNRRIVVVVREPGQARTYHALDLEAGTEERITPERMNPTFLSRDGKTVVAVNADGWWTVPLEGGDPRPIRGLEAGEFVFALTADGNGVFTRRNRGVSAIVHRVDSSTGAREVVHELTPPNLSGSGGVGTVHITPDGRFYVYGYTQQLSELYLVRGIR
jgi:dipeptidyl aminopeptidase/acylaminoacyl peptidase